MKQEEREANNKLRVLCKPYVTNNDDPDFETIIHFSLVDGETVECYEMELSKIREHFFMTSSFPLEKTL